MSKRSVKCTVCGGRAERKKVVVEETDLVRVTRDKIVCPDCVYQSLIGEPEVEYLGPTRECPVCDDGTMTQAEASVFEVDEQGREVRYLARKWECDSCLYRSEVRGSRTFWEYSRDTPGNKYRAMVESPGKYEGESVLTPWIWQEIVSHGGGETIYLDEILITAVEVDEKLRDEAAQLFTQEECAELDGVHVIALEEVESGFVYAYFFEEDEWAKFMRGVEDES
jgi:hypothetical protein